MVLKIPDGFSQAECIIKHSRFIGLAGAYGGDDLKKIISSTRKQYQSCSHVVHAFLSGPEGAVFGKSDDGEPRGTAGRPVLEVLRGSGITDVLVQVVRHFGGTLLGTGGLARAYTQSAQLALAGLPLADNLPVCRFSINLPYRYYQTVKKAIETAGGVITEEFFQTEVQMSGRISEEQFRQCDQVILDLSSGLLRLIFESD